MPLGSGLGTAEVDIVASVGSVVTSVGDGESVADGFVVDGAQIIAEEEELVFEDGPSGAAAEVVVGRWPSGRRSKSER